MLFFFKKKKFLTADTYGVPGGCFTKTVSEQQKAFKEQVTSVMVAM